VEQKNSRTFQRNGPKIQFVVCVLHKPKLLIFDEPFSGFDPVNANIIKDEILELQKQGSTIIFLHIEWKVLKSFVIILL